MIRDRGASHGRGRPPHGLPVVFGLICTWVLLAGCDMAADRADGVMDDYSAEERSVAAVSSALELPLPPAQSGPAQPLLIRNGSARVEVEDLDAAMELAQDVADEAGGFLAGTEVAEGREGARTASLVLRIPSDAFEGVVDQLPDLGRVLSVSISTSDISREYFDIETRLAVQRETVDRLRELADRGGDLEDLLAAERELGRALTELESLLGQLRYYDQRVAQSDLRLSLIEPGAVVTSGAFRPVVEAFRDATNVFARSLASLVYIVVFLTPWVIVALLLWPVVNRWRRGRKARADSPAA